MSIADLTRSAAHVLPKGALEAKLALARFIVARSHGEEVAGTAEEHFTRVVREGQAPPEESIEKVALPEGDPVHVPAVLERAFGMTRGEARRLIAQGAVRVNGEALTELDLPRETLVNALVQAGKRRFSRLTGP